MNEVFTNFLTVLRKNSKEEIEDRDECIWEKWWVPYQGGGVGGEGSKVGANWQKMGLK